MIREHDDLRRKGIVWIVFVLLLAGIHFSFHYSGDDLKLLNQSFGELVEKRWQDNGRVLTDAVAWISCFLPSKLWKLLDIAVIVAIAGMLRYLFTGKNNVENTALVCAAFLLFPFQILSTAGYIATIANYLYPFFTMLVVFTAIKQKTIPGKTTWWMYLLVILSVIYTTNQDQYAISLIFFLTILLIVSLKNDNLRHVRGLLWLEEIAAVLGYAALYFVPGHRFRMNTYGTWIPNYAQWTAGEKMFHGYTTTTAYLYYRQIPLLTVFFVLLLLTAMSTASKEKKRWAIFFTAIPLGVNLLLKGTGVDLLQPLPEVALGMPEIGSLSEGKNVVLFLLTVLLTASVFIGVWLAVDTVRRKVTILSLLFMGAGSRMAMGFSETLYGSSYRTYSFLLFCVVISVILLVQELREKANERTHGFAWGVIFLEILEQYGQSLQSLI